MKILLTGASGLVGSAFARLAARHGHEVIGISGRWSETVPGTAGLLARDLTDETEAAALVRGIHPVAVVHAAAISEPAACEADPVRSEAVNVRFPAALAAAAARARVRLIHLSTEQVFDGEGGPYSPVSPVNPLNLYGRQKRAAEVAVLDADPAAAVVRLPLLFGNSLTGRRSVHEKLFATWSEGRVATLFNDEVRQVCTADNVAEMLLALAARHDLRGIFHWAGLRPVSRWEMGVALCRHFGVAEKWIRAESRADQPGFTASRPRDLALDCTPLDREIGVRRETLEDAVRLLVRPKWAGGLAI